MPPSESGAGGYDPSFFHRLAVVEDRHFWFRARNRLIFALARKLSLQYPPEYLVLEVGCGTGNVLRTLRRACSAGTVIGMELWWEGLRFAQERSNGPLVQADIQRYPFGKQFALIGMFDVLEHIPTETETLHAVREGLLPGGTFMLTVPAHQFLWSHFDEAAHHCRRYSAAELRRKLRDAGFEVVFVSQFMASIFPLVWAFRMIAGLGKKPDAEKQKVLVSREFSVVPVLNGILTALLSLEALWVARGHRLPFGTSLIALARKPIGASANTFEDEM